MKKQIVLIVDDEPDMLEILEETLRDSEYIVMTALDGVDALEHMKEKTPDIIVCDLMMPRMNGYELLKILKSNPVTKKIPVIMLTKKDDFEAVFQLYEIGVVNFLPKPFELSGLIKAIESALARASEFE